MIEVNNIKGIRIGIASPEKSEAGVMVRLRNQKLLTIVL